MRLTITRNDPKFPAFYPVAYGPEYVSDRRHLNRAISDNVRTVTDRSIVTIEVMSDNGSRLYSGSIDGLKRKKL